MDDGIAGFVRARRERRGWSQTRLAQETGTSPAYVSQIEAGRSKLPSADLRRRIADALGVRHIDMLVAAGEITTEEVSSVASRWPTTDEKRIKLLEMVEALPDSALDYTLTTMGMIRDADWPPKP